MRPTKSPHSARNGLCSVTGACQHRGVRDWVRRPAICAPDDGRTDWVAGGAAPRHPRSGRHSARSAGLLAAVFTLLVAAPPVAAQPPADLPAPNVLWVSSEDNGPHLGAYGDDYATTPNLDALAARGLIYRNAWSTVPVCAPARTTIISGLYPASTGAHHMRSRSRLPDGFRFFPQVLREAGYYVTNNAKEDYNLEKPGGQGPDGEDPVWHESSREAHWRKRPDGAPFFAVFNFTVSHESQIRRRPHTPVHDPAKVRVPAYHPDVPEVRQDWAQYYDKLTEMDALVGERLAELDEAGLADDTIIFYWGDHGPGLPRGKRAALQTGLGVPLIVSIPEKYRHLAPAEYEPGGETDRLVGFIDFAPTMLSLAGLEPSAHFQGRAFLGAHEADPNEVIFGFSDRMDERYDMVRSVRDKRYVYARNFLVDRPYGQRLSYQMETPTTRVWLRLYHEGKLNEAQARFWREKPSEELLRPGERSGSGEQPRVLSGACGRPGNAWPSRSATTCSGSAISASCPRARCTGAPRRWAPCPGPTVWAATRSNASWPRRNSLPTVPPGTDAATERLRRLLGDPDSAVRAWAAIGLRARGEAAVQASLAELRAALRDRSAPVRAYAAEALGRFGEESDRQPVVELLLGGASIEENDFFDALLALNALDYLEPDVLGGTGSQAGAWRERLGALPSALEGLDRRFRNYVPRLLEAIALDLGGSVN